MKHYGTSTRKDKRSSVKDQPANEGTLWQPFTSEEGSREYSTIDGEVITRTDGTDAVSKGKGLFIGDYFVGILDSFSGWGSTPLLRY